MALQRIDLYLHFFHHLDPDLNQDLDPDQDPDPDQDQDPDLNLDPDQDQDINLDPDPDPDPDLYKIFFITPIVTGKQIGRAHV